MTATWYAAVNVNWYVPAKGDVMWSTDCFGDPVDPGTSKKCPDENEGNTVALLLVESGNDPSGTSAKPQLSPTARPPKRRTPTKTADIHTIPAIIFATSCPARCSAEMK